MNNKTKWAPGDRIQVKADNWTGFGSRFGAVSSHHPVSGRAIVKFDHGPLIDIDDQAIEPEGKKP